MKLETGLVELKETGTTFLIDSERIGFNELEIQNLNVSLQFSFFQFFGQRIKMS